MRLIVKAKEPASLTTYREAGGRYDGDNSFPPVKQAMRDALVAEQGDLCCYCTARIVADESMKIEHRIPQSSVDGERLALVWANVFGACAGGQGLPFAQQHCDTRKGDREITLDPTSPACLATLRYHVASGRIVSTNAVFQAEIDDVLNLNNASLVERRKFAVSGVFEAIIKRASARTIPDDVWRRQLATFAPASTARRLPPFCSAIADAIRKRCGT